MIFKSIIASYHASYMSFNGLNSEGAEEVLRSLEFMGFGPPFYGWAVNRFKYSMSIVNPLFFLDKNI